MSIYRDIDAPFSYLCGFLTNHTLSKAYIDCRGRENKQKPLSVTVHKRLFIHLSLMGDFAILTFRPSYVKLLAI